MDPRVFNASVLVGLLMVAAGTAVRFSWPVALIVVGSILIVGSIAAALVNPPRG